MTGRETAAPLHLNFASTQKAVKHMRLGRGVFQTFGPNPPYEATVGYQGPANRVSYARISPTITARGYALASSNMALSMRPAFRTGSHGPTPPIKMKNANTQAGQPWVNAYGIGRSGNSALPEASVFAISGGQTSRLRKPSVPENYLSGKL